MEEEFSLLTNASSESILLSSTEALSLFPKQRWFAKLKFASIRSIALNISTPIPPGFFSSMTERPTVKRSNGVPVRNVSLIDLAWIVDRFFDCAAAFH